MATTNKKETKTKAKKETKKTTKKTVKKTATTSKPVKKPKEKTDKKVVEKEVKVVEKEINVKENKPLTTNQPPAKRRLVVNYNQLAPKLIELLNEKYPSGWRDYILKVEKGNGDFFHAIMLDTDDVSYLIKVSVKVDNDITDDIEKDLFGMSHDDDFIVDDEQDEDYDDKDDALA
ncbi:MAG: hypothetical protein LBS69_12895 [Prevotellaceae bacterium]|jgi:hypothetical protein|nr:hypothetical protein [Prevotellaceae bacterium]